MLAVAAMAADAGAQAHGPPPASLQSDAEESATTRAEQLAEMDQWLRRLVGRFRYEGKLVFPIIAGVVNGRPQKAYEEMQFEGKGDCVAIGTGPGVQCIVDVDWPTSTPRRIEVPPSPYSPAMTLYGIDPGVPGIRYLQINNKGLPEGSMAPLEGNRIKFITPCVNASPNCRRIVRITATPDNKVEMTLETWTDYSGQQLEPTVTVTFKLRRQESEPTK
jgi:hypothetical protein